MSDPENEMRLLRAHRGTHPPQNCRFSGHETAYRRHSRAANTVALFSHIKSPALAVLMGMKGVAQPPSESWAF
jgi:hypothetical protein